MLADSACWIDAPESHFQDEKWDIFKNSSLVELFLVIGVLFCIA